MEPVVFVVDVETLRKPSTGLKPSRAGTDLTGRLRRDTQKTQHGIETDRGTALRRGAGRDTQKTQHGIETARRRHGYAHYVETLRKPSTGLKPT